MVLAGAVAGSLTAAPAAVPAAATLNGNFCSMHVHSTTIKKSYKTKV